jgi:hypothetical protein
MVPFLPLNPNVTNKFDEAFLSHIEKNQKEGFKDKNGKNDSDQPRKALSKVKKTQNDTLIDAGEHLRIGDELPRVHLANRNAKVNPPFDMKILRKYHSMARTSDYLPKESNA